MIDLANVKLSEQEEKMFNVINFEGAFIEFNEHPYAVIMLKIFLKILKIEWNMENWI